MDSIDKQRRGFLGAYSSNAGNFRPEPDIAAKASKPMSRSWVLRKSKEDSGRGDREAVNLVEARKSVSHVETNLSSVVAFLQVKVLATDMPGFMQVHAFRCARRTYDSLEKFSTKHMAHNMKKEFDRVYGPAWHCIVGSSFGSFVTHATVLAFPQLESEGLGPGIAVGFLLWIGLLRWAILWICLGPYFSLGPAHNVDEWWISWAPSGLARFVSCPDARSAQVG